MKYLKTFEQFINQKYEAVNEYTSRSFKVPKPKKVDRGSLMEIGEIIPYSVKTSKKAEKKIKEFDGGTMFVHVGYVEWPEEEIRISYNQYYINDYEEKMQKKKNPRVSTLTVWQDGERLGTVFAETDAFMKDLKLLRRNLGPEKSVS